MTPAEHTAPPTVAALYVDPNGVYANLPGVEVWDEARDARTYAGPWPVVAHPPCNRWSRLALCRNQRDGNDGGCFEHALWAVRTFGGVLEHPAHSLAWKRYGLPLPGEGGGWVAVAFGDDGVATFVDQHWYGHPERKPTWLYAAGCELPLLRSGRFTGGRSVQRMNLSEDKRYGRSRTPEPFRDVLLGMARSAARVPA